MKEKCVFCNVVVGKSNGGVGERVGGKLAGGRGKVKKTVKCMESKIFHGKVKLTSKTPKHPFWLAFLAPWSKITIVRPEK